MVKIEDIVFWILIILIIATALWLLHGSPAESNALIAVALFVATSEVLLWKALFKLDRKTSIGFVKLDKSLSDIKDNQEYKFYPKKNQNQAQESRQKSIREFKIFFLPAR